MIKLITTGYSSDLSCEEIFLDDSLNIVERKAINGIGNASFVAIKDNDSYFVSEESDKYAKIHEVRNGNVIKSLDLATCGIVYLSFLEKCGIMISGSYTNGDVLFNDKNVFKVNSAHSVIPDASQKFIYVTDIKADKIFVFELTSGIVVDEVCLPFSSGPRHLKFYKSFLYLVTEYSNEIYVFSHNEENGKLEFVSKYSTIINGNGKENYAAAISIKDGILAVSNRGENTISFFNIKENGTLKSLYEISSGGNWPRDIKFYKNYLFVANERSNEICIFNTNDKSGKVLLRIEKKGANFISFIKAEL